MSALTETTSSNESMTKSVGNWPNLYFVVHDLASAILKKIEDFEVKIHRNTSLKRDFYNIEFVYMHSILLDFAKLISATGSDKSGLTQLRNGAPKDVLERIEALQHTHSDLFSKVKANRNKIVAHVDISETDSYFKLGLSAMEIKKKIQDLENYSRLTGDKIAIPQIIEDFKSLEATSPGKERYSPSDFSNDLGKFKFVTKEIIKIADDLNGIFYNRILSSDKK